MEAKNNFPPILLLHGWGGSSKSLSSLNNLLREQKFQTFAIDLPGFGQSPFPTKPLVLDDYLEIINSKLQSENIKQIILLGHSFGGKISAKFAANYPSKVSHLILINASGIEPNNLNKKRIFENISKAGKSILNNKYLKTLIPLLRKIYYKVFVRESDYYKLKDENMKKTFKNIISEHLNEEDLSRITAPTLLIWGEADKLTPLWMGKKFNKFIKHSKLEIVESESHNLPLIKPEIVSKIIYNYFKD